MSSLHLKAAEIRNSIAHLDYSNEELAPFAAENDQDCIEAIRENEGVIARMQERLELLKAEVERRGGVWTEFMTKEEVERMVNGTTEDGAEGLNGGGRDVNGDREHEAWTDGTFTTGRISGGEVFTDGVQGAQGRREGGRLTDEELRRALEERIGEDEEDDGMHL